jgi:hypothetical protein
MKLAGQTARLFNYCRYTVPKTRQISENIREEVPYRDKLIVIRRNDDKFPRTTWKFSLQGTSTSLRTKNLPDFCDSDIGLLASYGIGWSDCQTITNSNFS